MQSRGRKDRQRLQRGNCKKQILHVSWYTTYRSAMLVATCNRLFQISSETRTIEIDDSIVRRYASDTERDRESYTEVCDVCFSRPIILDVQACYISTSTHRNPQT